MNTIMSRLTGILAVLICLSLGCSACGLKNSNSELSEEDSRQSDDALAHQRNFENSIDPGNSYYLFMESQILKKQGLLDEAIDYIQQAISQDSDSLYLKMELAILYLQEDDNEKALATVETLLQQHPDSVEALIIAASIKTRIDPKADVKPLYEKILVNDPERENVYQVLGKMYFTEGDMDNAFRIYTAMRDHFPENYVGYYYLGEIYGVRSDYEKAEASFLKTLELNPDLNEARQELVKIYHLTRQEQKIIQMYEEILKRDPDHLMAAIELAIAYDNNKKDRVQSQAILQRLGEKSMSDPKVVATILKYLVLQKRSDDAVTVLNGMYAAAPDNPEIAYALGIVYYEKDKLDLALKKFSSVSSDTRFYANALMHMAIIYYQNKAYDKGIAMLENALPKLSDTDKLELIPYMTAFYKEKKMVAESIALIQQGLAIDPENTDLLFELGVIYDRQGKTDLAIAEMEKVIQLNPEHPDALNYLGYTYADQGIRLDEAERMIKKALEYKPDNGYIIDSLGWLYFRRGFFDQALTHLERAASLIPDDPVLLEHLGDVHRQLNNPQKALEYYQRAIEKKVKDDQQDLQKKINSLKSDGV